MRFKKFLSVVCAGCMALSVMPFASAADASISMDSSMASVKALAYMDLESAPVAMQDDILRAREQIIFGDQAWTVDGAVSLICADGTVEMLPEFSDLYPGWDIPTRDISESNYTESLTPYSTSVDIEEQISFTMAVTWANSKDFTQFTGTGDYVYVYAKSLPRDAYFNIGFASGVGTNLGWCPNLNKSVGAKIDTNAGKVYNVRGSAADKASEGKYRIAINSDEADAMEWLEPMLP